MTGARSLLDAARVQASSDPVAAIWSPLDPRLQAGVGTMQYTDLFIIMTNTGTGANTLAAIDFD